jgi:hypothetical protein
MGATASMESFIDMVNQTANSSAESLAAIGESLTVISDAVAPVVQVLGDSFTMIGDSVNAVIPEAVTQTIRDSASTALIPFKMVNKSMIGLMMAGSCIAVAAIEAEQMAEKGLTDAELAAKQAEDALREGRQSAFFSKFLIEILF